MSVHIAFLFANFDRKGRLYELRADPNMTVGELKERLHSMWPEAGDIRLILNPRNDLNPDSKRLRETSLCEERVPKSRSPDGAFWVHAMPALGSLTKETRDVGAKGGKRAPAAEDEGGCCVIA